MAIGFRVQASEALFRALSQFWGLSFDSTVGLRFFSLARACGSSLLLVRRISNHSGVWMLLKAPLKMRETADRRGH